jgi:putative selenate reductase
LGAFDCIQAPCQDGCPANQNVPDYLYLVARGRYTEALEVVLQTNPLPTITGTVCDHPCMNKCVRSHYDRALAIREIKRFITERANGRDLPSPAARRSCSIGVIGAGPAGLAAAVYLAIEGFAVTVYDAREHPGGVPDQMIPAYRLPASSLAADLEPIQGLGVEFRFHTRVGLDVGFAQLRAQHDYLFIGVGAQQGLALRIEGEQADGVFDCLDFLSQARQECKLELGRRVLVVGGGNSAMDAARTAWRLVGRQGEVTLVYRRTEAQMPADEEELEALRDEGIGVRVLTSPARVVVEEGRVVGLECVEMSLGPPDDSGRPRPVPVDGSETILPADAILVAVGQKTDVEFLRSAGLAMTRWDTLRVDDTTAETSLPGVFAGGDVVRGGGSIIQAAADARRAVREILKREGVSSPTGARLVKEGTPREYLVRKSRRIYPEPIPLLPIERRRGFDQVGLSLSEQQAQREAGRCLDCDAFCGLCVTVCPNRANLHYRTGAFEAGLHDLRVEAGRIVRSAARRFRVEQDQQIVNLADLCNECGNCQTFCPAQGAPYLDKPRLCFSQHSFDEQERAHRLEVHREGFRIWYKEPDGVHSLVQVGQRLRYRSPRLLAELEAPGFVVSSLGPGPDAADGDHTDLRRCASMFVLARGLSQDARFLPIWEAGA